MEDFIKSQILPTIKYLPSSLLKSYFISKSNSETEKIAEKPGFIKGICHPGERLDLVKECGLQWVRVDIPFPYNSDGSISESYIGFKEKLRRFKEKGFKNMVISPYPEHYIEYGLDPRIKENESKIEDIARFLITDLKGLADGMQITNEQGIPRFTLPLTIEESARFIGINARAMFPLRGDIIIGYNCAGPQTDLNVLMKPYLKFIDYVGIDIYMGCFFFGTMWIFDALLRYLYTLTKKPVMLCEFGYISGGAPKSKEEKNDIIKSYGFANEKEARANITAFLENFPERMKEYVKKCAVKPEHYADYIFKSEFTNHFYRELPRLTVIPGYPHTPEGQAKFYKDIIKRLRKYDFLCGMFIYCWEDSSKCYVCGQSDCPTETRWGLVDLNEEPKPSYYAVKEEFNK